MTKEKITVVKAISKRKATQIKIAKLIKELQCNEVIQTNATMVNGMSISEWEGEQVKKFNEITTLTLNYDSLSSAINLFNATTIIKVGNMEMTVSEALSRTNPKSINNLEMLAKKMNINYDQQTKKAKRLTAINTTEDKISAIVAFNKIACSSKVKDEQLKAKAIEDSSYTALDPLQHQREDVLSRYNGFLEEVEEAISVANCNGVIDVTFYD